MGQQSLLMTLANVAPWAPEPTWPIANQSVAPPQSTPVPVSHIQPQGVWDIDAVSRDASDTEPLLEDSIEAEVASQHPGQKIDPEVLDTNDPICLYNARGKRSGVGVLPTGGRCVHRIGEDANAIGAAQGSCMPKQAMQDHGGGPQEGVRCSYRGSQVVKHGQPPVYQAALIRDLPECPSIALRTELGTVTQLLVKLAELNARAQGRSIASLVVARRQLWLSQARVQETDKVPLLDAPVSPEHTFGPAVEEMLQRSIKECEASQQMAALIRDLPECPSIALRTELGTVTQLLVKLAELNARAQGRSIASLVVARRQLWLSQARVQETDKVPLLDAPVSPEHTFGPAVEEMLQRSIKECEASQQMVRMWPNKPFQPKRQQDHQWLRTPPQQQAQPRGGAVHLGGPGLCPCNFSQGFGLYYARGKRSGVGVIPTGGRCVHRVGEDANAIGAAQGSCMPKQAMQDHGGGPQEGVRCSHRGSQVVKHGQPPVYQAALIRDLPECPSIALRTELGTVTQLLVKLAELNARAQGRSIASLVVARRQLWLSQARVQETDKVPLLDAPVSPEHTFGPAVEEMLQRSIKECEASQQMVRMWPNKPFQPKRQQDHQWLRTPPQQQAQPRGNRTSPSGASTRGQPAARRVVP
ncbi:UNVERIFIED_CONTAM: hypothetical protein FKN15_038942 [Acipenser sinensis]